LSNNGESLGHQEMNNFFVNPKINLEQAYQEMIRNYKYNFPKTTFDFIERELKIGPFESRRLVTRERPSNQRDDYSQNSSFSAFRSSRTNIHQKTDNFYVVYSDDQLFYAFATESPETIAVHQVLYVTIMSKTSDG
jgi:hypothetical protein